MRNRISSLHHSNPLGNPGEKRRSPWRDAEIARQSKLEAEGGLQREEIDFHYRELERVQGEIVKMDNKASTSLLITGGVSGAVVGAILRDGYDYKSFYWGIGGVVGLLSIASIYGLIRCCLG